MQEVMLPKEPLIAIVEDDQFVRNSMQRLMKSFGYTVAAFASAEDFLASQTVNQTACLISDIQMPEMSGVELYRHLIKINAGRAIPTILVTAYPDDAVRAMSLKEGVVCYLRKPLNDEELMRCLRSALERGKPPEENER